MPKTVIKPDPNSSTVRTRRAYFDCRFGQLHVRTAFPTTGGFDEQTTLFCLHPDLGSSRIYSRFLPLIASDRSVYAPDLPGWGESDPPPAATTASSAVAVADLAKDLRLHQIDLVGLHAGGTVAIELALAHPALVRRLIVIGGGFSERLAQLRQPTLLMRIGSGAAADRDHARLPPGSQMIDAPEYADDLFDAAPQTLARQFGAFLSKNGSA